MKALLNFDVKFKIY